jgi:phage gp36-like protein
MIFLNQEDFKTVIKSDNLGQMLNNDFSILDMLELSAIALIKTYLKNKYDLTNAFNAEDRNNHMVSICIDIMLYDLYAKVSPKQVSEVRVVRYDAAIKFLEMVAKGELELDLPFLDTYKGGIIYGNTPNKYHL